VPGAVLGLAIEVERRGAAAFDAVASRSTGVARVVSKPRIVQRALRPVEDALWRWNEVARREQSRNQAQAAALIPVIVQQATENVIAQLDFVRIVRQVPVDEIVAALDVEAIVARIDLTGVIRESTASLTGEAVDALRSEGIALDGWAARIVDKVLLRRNSRNVELGGER
jgi:cobalamin-dependent methionine synthase I